MSEAKQFDISKKAVIAAFQAVKENAGSYGADEQTIKEFEEHLNNNLYKLWNRMASGSYFPKPVRAVAIPKKNGGIRILGIPEYSCAMGSSAIIRFGSFSMIRYIV